MIVKNVVLNANIIWENILDLTAFAAIIIEPSIRMNITVVP